MLKANKLELKNQKKSKAMKIQMKFTCDRRLITAAVAAKKHTPTYTYTHIFSINANKKYEKHLKFTH